MILPHSEDGVVKQAWGSAEAERWNDLTQFQHPMQRFDPTSVWCAAPAEAPLLLCSSLLSVFLSLRTQMSQTKALKQRTVFQFNTSNKRKRNSIWWCSIMKPLTAALQALGFIFIEPCLYLAEKNLVSSSRTITICLCRSIFQVVWNTKRSENI